MPNTWWNAEAGIIYEASADYTENYVNGNSIDISYSYQKDYSNSAGIQTYDIGIDTNKHHYAACDGVNYGPIGAYYWTSTHPIKNVSSRPALILTFVSTSDDFYRIHCKGTGPYVQNTFWESTNNVTVMIDPESGDLIDIVEYNYFYHWNPGSNVLRYSTPYIMKKVK